MPRIHPVNRATADSKTANLLVSVERAMGRVPNMIATMAKSPSAAQAYLGFSQSLSTGQLSNRLREQIALVVGETNSCDYCVAAHTALGEAAGLTGSEASDARRGLAQEEKERAALQFARAMVEKRGLVSDEDLGGVREAGHNDGEIAEIVANVALNIFTNYFNHVADTELDFPVAPELKAA